MTKPVQYFLVCLLCALSSKLSAQHKKDTNTVVFDRIFGESTLSKYDADTLTGSSERKVIYSGAKHTITGYNEKGKKLWSRTITEQEDGLIAFMLVQPLDRKNPNKRYEIYLQFKDKTAYALNIKTGKFKLLKM